MAAYPPSSPEPTVPNHYVVLAYYNTDDGIWLCCGVAPDHPGCGWSRNLGWWPTPAEAATAASEHLDGAKT